MRQVINRFSQNLEYKWHMSCRRNPQILVLDHFTLGLGFRVVVRWGPNPTVQHRVCFTRCLTHFCGISDFGRGMHPTGCQSGLVFFRHIIFFFFYSVLRWSVAVSTMHRQSSRIAAFLQADARPIVLLAKVCLHCTKPGVAWSSYRSFPIWRQPPDHRSDSTMVVLLW